MKPASWPSKHQADNRAGNKGSQRFRNHGEVIENCHSVSSVSPLNQANYNTSSGGWCTKSAWLVQDHGHVDHIAIRIKLLNPVANCKINFLLITIPASSQVYPMSKTTITLITLYSRKLTFLSALYPICYPAQNHNMAMCRYNTVSISIIQSSVHNNVEDLAARLRTNCAGQFGVIIGQSTQCGKGQRAACWNDLCGQASQSMSCLLTVFKCPFNIVS